MQASWKKFWKHMVGGHLLMHLMQAQGESSFSPWKWTNKYGTYIWGVELLHLLVVAF